MPVKRHSIAHSEENARARTYENHGPTLQFFYAFSIILIIEEKFQLQFPAQFVEKRIAQMQPLDSI